MMDFDEQAICADGNGSAGKRQNLVALSGAVAGIDEDRQVATLLNRRNDREVERIAGKIGECANAALAKHHIVVALREDVFRGHQELIKRGGHTALEKNWLLCASGPLEEREILHIARANLDDVGVFLDKIERLVVDGFRDDAKTVGGADF